MVGVLAGGVLFALLLFGIIQLMILWTGQSAVEAAAHFAARRFALLARTDPVRARQAALSEASRLCRERPGGRGARAAMTSVDLLPRLPPGPATPPRPGATYQVGLTHWVELAVPWVDRLVYAVATTPKTRIGNRYYVALRASRRITVE